MEKEWFADWFNSPYYHVLYKNHNESEAQMFINNLFEHATPQYLDKKPTSSVTMLDLACGRGRHSRYMASKGFDVTGLDLSEKSIAFAKQFEADNLHFYQHDMRKLFRTQYFDFIFNIFTSFGYFDNPKHNLQTLKQVHKGLKNTGVFVLDYFNSQHVIDTLMPHQTILTDGIEFRIDKWVADGCIFKKIAFSTVENNEPRHFVFQERVQLFSQADFESLLAEAGLKIIEKFGDYHLGAFDTKTSKRLIIKAIKI